MQSEYNDVSCGSGLCSCINFCGRIPNLNHFSGEYNALSVLTVFFLCYLGKHMLKMGIDPVRGIGK